MATKTYYDTTNSTNSVLDSDYIVVQHTNSGTGYSSDLTQMMKTTIGNIRNGAQANVLEGISFKGSGSSSYSDLPIIAKKAQLDLSAYVLNTRTINGNALASNVTIDGSNAYLSPGYTVAGSKASPSIGDSIDTAIGKIQKEIVEDEDDIATLQSAIEGLSAGVTFKGSTTYANLPAASASNIGWEYWVTDMTAFYVSDGSSWINVGAEIVDSLDSTATNKALSANQGKVLGDEFYATGIYVDTDGTLSQKTESVSEPKVKIKKQVITDSDGYDIADGLNAIVEALGGTTELTFKQIQKHVRAGDIDNYLSIGDEITVERESSLNISSSNSSLTVTINEETWINTVEALHHGVYEFTYDGYEWSNNELGIGLDMSYYGITISGTPVADDVIAVTVSTDILTFVYVDKDHVAPVNPNLTHSATFQLKECYVGEYQFSNSEALISAQSEMAAGTYHFNFYKPSNIYYLNAGLHNKNAQFTTTKTIPAGGVLKISAGDIRNDGGTTAVSDIKLTSYAADRTTVIESNIACSEGTSGTDLGNANTAANNKKVNSTDRCLYGSNNWKESALRVRMNSNKKTSWWSPQGPFDMPPSGNSGTGFVHGIEKDFLDVLQMASVTTSLNWFDGGGTRDSKEFFFVPGNNQVYFSGYPAEEGVVWDYYRMFSDNTSASNIADSNRIKRLPNGNAAYWWTRTPVGSYSSREYSVHPTGAYSDGYADGSHGVAPACIIA